MNKTYRIYNDIEGESEDDVVAWADEVIGNTLRDEGTVDGIFKVKEQPFTEEEELSVMEIARVALIDADLFDLMANKLDLSDKEMQKLRDKIEAAMK